jgi:hypothetical protein
VPSVAVSGWRGRGGGWQWRGTVAESVKDVGHRALPQQQHGPYSFLYPVTRRRASGRLRASGPHGFERREPPFAPGVLLRAGEGGVAAAIGTTVSTVRALRSSLLGCFASLPVSTPGTRKRKETH